ncbi:MAG TPA: UDP-N-acetylmuramoylalanyl-D-glutamyl-2,6-diaminopimelate--D-alanyl-D-alanine ligase [Hypericibacter adhaerens]|uniref:UDP-N-acetylmuramoyl-tripeptide--D-alanyl-D-alanine ligase n=1 Tax=Hypericibacter adhaerens TaxID=2602016 RepID=A0A5J6MVU3_9PROT|nr:UDP-N-acetylmuramoylalanyl-D-glutamyl-2,6-diaminopimelate--D-alanyl-D-alanine ligase [Hypericibacter adhaerens]QEX21227.1 UDP-N-acetylmuramoyl-tripeptide--D-alanyl-D-alanine ligase [Hypericibacter adhaerens]HWA43401.1 UDP-N-acetylmuramoylalanyl-D-glutamyl-2,6-diaminopimelate--D-alanyl-D-alanine ligase [Hypericibacter adhaerens]
MTAARPVLWTAADAASAARGQLQGAPGWAATGISIDSRTVEPGDLFVALKGPSFDGHDYIGKSLAAGAVAALAHRRPEGLGADAPLLMVEETLAGLERMGQASRARCKARRIGITGSVGKTGTKEALKTVLSGQAPTFAAAGSFNNQWGVPLTLARMPRDTVYGVFELGMNHAGELGPLSRQVRPEITIITTIEAAHMEFFASIEAVADAKAEIFEGMDADGIAILNRDNAQFERLAGHARRHGLRQIIGFGSHPEATSRLLDCSLQATCSAVNAVIEGERLDYCIGAPGQHWVMNSLAVLAAVKAAGADLHQAASAFAKVLPPKGRGQRSQVMLPAQRGGGSIELIDESYNASPAAVRAALRVLAQAKPRNGGRRIAVLGDMRELGPESPALHAGLAPDLIAAGVELAFTVGPLMTNLDAALPAAMRAAHAETSAEIIAPVLAMLKPGDVVLVKGSLGTRMAPIVEAIKAMGASAPMPRAANGN